MAIDNIIGSPFTVNTEQSSNTKVAADRPAIPPKESIEMEAAVKGNSTSHENVSKENVSEAIEKMNDFLAPTRRNLKFELHDKLDKYYVSVVDSNTDEVIKEIPPKKFLDMYAAMAEYMGILVDQKI